MQKNWRTKKYAHFNFPNADSCMYQLAETGEKSFFGILNNSAILFLVKSNSLAPSAISQPFWFLFKNIDPTYHIPKFQQLKSV
jgi:hypothetical protein